VATWVIDLDGVMWWGDRPVAGSADAVGRLLDAGRRVVFCTNHARAPQRKRQQLDRMGVPDAPVVTSAEAAVRRCEPGRGVLVLGDPSLVDLVAAAGLPAVDARDVDEHRGPPEVGSVVVGAHEDWDRSRVGWAADAVRAGARFLATNADPTFPAAGAGGRRLLPGNGALVAAVAVAAGREPEVCGKPHEAMAELLVERYGTVDVVVGDLPATDGVLAARLGAAFALVHSGVTPAGAPREGLDPAPARVGADLAALVDAALTAGEPGSG
jgi:HAD superfamily hydrolase (TIGR01450 family)